MKYLTRLELLPGAGKNSAYSQMVFNEYGLHQLVWSLWSDRPDRERDFLYRLEDTPGKFSLLTLSSRPPEDQRGLFRLQTREFNPQLEAGDKLGFRLRANPTVARKREGKRSARHDVVMDAKHQNRQNGVVIPNPLLIQQAGVSWLLAREERLGCAFNEASIRADSYRQHRLRPGMGRGEIRLSSLDYEGVLEVREPALFLEALFQGIGSQKAFGCGLMLIRRV